MGLDFNLEAGNGVKIEGNPIDKSITISLTDTGGSPALTQNQIAALNNPKANGSSKFLTYREAADIINEKESTPKGFPKLLDTSVPEDQWEFTIKKTGVYKIMAVAGGGCGFSMIGDQFPYPDFNGGFPHASFVEVNDNEVLVAEPEGTVDIPFPYIREEGSFSNERLDAPGAGGSKCQSGQTCFGTGGEAIQGCDESQHMFGAGGAGSTFPINAEVKNTTEGKIIDKTNNTTRVTYNGGTGYGAGGGGAIFTTENLPPRLQSGGYASRTVRKRIILKKGDKVKVHVGKGAKELIQENSEYRIIGGKSSGGAVLIEWDNDQW